MKLPPQRQRIITALLLLAVLIICLFTGGWLLRIFTALAAAVGLYEFYSLFWPKKRHIGTKVTGIFMGVCIVLAQGVSLSWILGILCLAFVLVSFFFLVSYGSGDTKVTLPEFSPLILGLAYIPLTLQLALYLNLWEQLLVIFAAIATDTGGFYAGSLFGRHKMCPLISPKKSWEGSFGGLLLCTGICVIMGYWNGSPGSTSVAGASIAPAHTAFFLPLWGWGIIGIILNISAQLGDFFESALKRSLNTKDSGFLLPGHGGLLDRIDSILFVLPAYFVIRTLYITVSL